MHENWEGSVVELTKFRAWLGGHDVFLGRDTILSRCLSS